MHKLRGRRYALQRSIDPAAIGNDKKCNGIYPLICNDLPNWQAASRRKWSQNILKPVKTKVSTTHRAPGEQGKPAGGSR
jgi:hypothetical protein